MAGPVATYIRAMPTALLSVYDKTGIVELAAGLHAAGWRIVSSGGTAKVVAAAGVPVTDLVELTETVVANREHLVRWMPWAGNAPRCTPKSRSTTFPATPRSTARA